MRFLNVVNCAIRDLQRHLELETTDKGEMSAKSLFVNVDVTDAVVKMMANLLLGMVYPDSCCEGWPWLST